jgi:hypothetical protein
MQVFHKLNHLRGAIIAILQFSIVIKLKGKRWEEHVTRLGEMRKIYTILVEKSEEKIPLG